VNPDPFNHDVKVEQLLEEFKNTKNMEKLIEMRRTVSEFAEDCEYSREQINFHYKINRNI
jgi:predicted house-cleaning noncanonical NTP pyrophosphatase (MazG superfamily)